MMHSSHALLFASVFWALSLITAPSHVYGAPGDEGSGALGENPVCAMNGCAPGCPCTFDSYADERLLKFGYGMTGHPEMAAYWYERAAKNGGAQSAYNWGLILKTGRGVPTNLEAALPWLKEAADKGVAGAYYVLGNMYRTGIGVERNPRRAVAYYTVGAEAGDVRSQNALGNMHGNGFGSGPDMILAYKWWLVASEKGDPLATRAKARAEVVMDWRDVKRAERLAEDWKAARR